ncbi:MAG: hypothetical protein QOE32_3064, partial [Pseudonocardiales bacterium]|nr:hypothetical protein [Pseudonocardiales bacterium]
MSNATGSEVAAAKWPINGGPTTKPSQPNAETVAIAVPWFSRGMLPAALFTVGTTL